MGTEKRQRILHQLILTATSEGRTLILLEGVEVLGPHTRSGTIGSFRKKNPALVRESRPAVKPSLQPA